MSSLFDCSGEVAVVIGGTGVLGGSLAEGLAAQGAKVAVCGRREERGAIALQAIRRSRRHRTICTLRCFRISPASRQPKPPLANSLARQLFSVNAAGGNNPSVTVVGDHKFEHIQQR